MALLSESIIPDTLLNEFKTCTRLYYNGKLDIELCTGYKFSFYYRLGRIVWASGGAHPLRRWKRNIAQYCPQINLDTIKLQADSQDIEYWDYQVLEALYKNQKIKREQVIQIIYSTIGELLFDLTQQTSCNISACQRDKEVILEAPMSLSSTAVSLEHIFQSWHCWSEAGLANFSPNLAPVLRLPEQLQHVVNPAVYDKFVKLMKGNYTLRDIAAKAKQDVLSIGRSLLPYILRGFVELVKVEDFRLFTKETKNICIRTQSLKTPLIACIDDSLRDCWLLEDIITHYGMKFVGIHNPLKILPTLTERKPDLIFLDLAMPVIDGYQVCSQIQRISSLAKTPVVILTDSNGLFNRMRAQVAGSNDFIPKPVAADQVMDMVRKHLHVNITSLDYSSMGSKFEVSYV
ncbi:response regulator receiver protein [Calothrix sp. NIES-4071]|nr:response regulator receiver protein [Calothrix sp. NIES-4071]BAZ56823.1 response regulator receiver protein [Calothrix sp. NIES-4105]